MKPVIGTATTMISSTGGRLLARLAWVGLADGGFALADEADRM